MRRWDCAAQLVFLTAGKLGPLRRDERPVLLPLRPLLDPAAQQSRSAGPSAVCPTWRGGMRSPCHRRGDALPQLAVVQLAGHDRVVAARSAKAASSVSSAGRPCASPSPARGTGEQVSDRIGRMSRLNSMRMPAGSLPGETPESSEESVKARTENRIMAGETRGQVGR